MLTFTTKTFPMRLHTLLSRLFALSALFYLIGFPNRAAAQLTVGLGANTFICPGASVQLTPDISGGTEPYSYLWTPATGLSCTTCRFPFASPNTTTTYQLTVTDALNE
ncbi:MAG: hypothetical protein ACKV1O_28320, partial [Saprospiraceae bacterium]